nr:MAG TPA_asm: hypothetical protein [Caudoviricetes sp.]
MGSATGIRLTSGKQRKNEPRNSGAFYCASHAHFEERLSVVSLGKPFTLGGFAMRQAHI